MMYLARLCKRHISSILFTLLVLLFCLIFIRLLNFFGTKHRKVYLIEKTSYMETEGRDKDDMLKKGKFDPGSGNDKDPVDMVYIWLNASDPEIAHELRALGSKEHKIPQEILSQNRYNDWQTLKYSLRSVEKFAPWIRTIYIVTNGQIPYWLALDNHRINIIAHKEIFSNRSDLPTFLSPAIECHLHQIFGLSKRFIYMRDDVILKTTLDLSYFHDENDGYKLRLVEDGMELCNQLCLVRNVNNRICEPKCVTESCEFDGDDCKQVNTLPVYPGTDKGVIYNAWDASMRHTSFIFNSVFEPTDRYMPLPGPHMLNKDIFTEMVNSFPDELRQTSSTKILNNMTFLPVFAYHNYLRTREQLGKSDFKSTTLWPVDEVGHNDFSVRSEDFIIDLLMKIIKGQGTFLVLSNYFCDISNDSEKNTRKRIFTKIFEDMFPTTSQFEMS